MSIADLFKWYCTVLAWSIMAHAHCQLPFHRSFTMADGLPSNKVYRAIQDREGFMWFATDNGVARFDGLEFMNLSLADGISDTEVIMIQEDHEGRIWFLTLNGMLSYWKDGSIFNERNDQRLEGIYATAGWSTMAVDEHGALWFGALSGELVRLDMSSGKHRFVGASSSKRNVFQDAKGEVLALGAGFLYQLDSTGQELLSDLGDAVHSTHIYPSGECGMDPLIMKGGLLYQVSSSGVSLLLDGPKLDPLVHRSAFRTPKGDIWLHRHDRGVDLVEAITKGFSPIVHYFSDRYISMVFTDGSGNDWFCTPTQGVVLVTHFQRKYTRWLIGPGEKNAVMTAIGTGAHRIWIGTDQGNLLVFEKDSLSAISLDRDRVRPGRVLRILGEPDGTMWFGTDYSLFRWTPKKPSTLFHVPAYSEPSGPAVWTAVKALMRTRQGEILTAGLGLQRVQSSSEGLSRHYWLKESSLRYRVRGLCEDDKGTLWAAAKNGLLAIVGDSAMPRSLPDNVISSEVVDMVAYGGDTLLLATRGDGLILWSSGRVVQRIREKEGLPTLNLRRLRKNGDTLWCATPSGLVALVLRKGEVVRTWSWSKDQGLPTNDVFDFSIDHDRLFMVTDQGLGVCPLRPEDDRMTLGPLHVARVMLNDSVIARPTQRQWLSRRGDRFQLEVHALEFVHAPLVEYAYALDRSGVWRSCSKGQVILDGMDDGLHTISVKARLPGGLWCAPLVVTVDVAPPWWARRWVISTASILTIISLVIGLRRHERSRYRERLADVQAQMALNEERRRIAADVHDDLGADLSRLLLQVRRTGADPDEYDNRIRQGITAAINKIDEIIWSLDPRRDTLEGTLTFAEQLAIEICEANGMSFRTNVQLTDRRIPLSAKARREVFLIIKESIRNVVEHACATTLRLGAEMAGEVVVISIEDDGVGFLPTISTPRNGMKNMRERAARLGGMIIVRPNLPQGTRVELHFPLNNHPNG